MHHYVVSSFISKWNCIFFQVSKTENLIENGNIPVLLMKWTSQEYYIAMSQKARYEQKEPFSTVIESVFRSIRCNPSFPLTFIYAHVTKTGKNQNNNNHLKSMADTSKNNHQQIDENWFCVFLLLMGLRSPQTVRIPDINWGTAYSLTLWCCMLSLNSSWLISTACLHVHNIHKKFFPPWFVGALVN